MSLGFPTHAQTTLHPKFIIIKQVDKPALVFTSHPMNRRVRCLICVQFSGI